MSRRYALLILCTAVICGSAHAQPTADVTSTLKTFRTYCGRSVALWGKSLCGPIILVDPQTRSATATTDPKLPGFALQSGLWTGTLPSSTSIANTSIELGGQRIAEIMLPLPQDPVERRILL